MGVGSFSETKTVRTLGLREPDSPVLSSDKMKIEKNSFSVPLKHTDDGGTPLQHFNIRYKQDKEGAEWKELRLLPDVDAVSLQGLSFGSDYQLEVTAVNANGSSSPATFNFTVAMLPGIWPPTPHTIHSLRVNGCEEGLLTVLKAWSSPQGEKRPASNEHED